MRAGHSVRSSDETSMIGLARGYDDCANPRSRRDLTPDCCGYSKGLAHAGHVVRARRGRVVRNGRDRPRS
jgi:hypothetical protein